MRLPGAVQKEPATSLRYAIEVATPKSVRSLGMLEPLLERVVYEDVPANLLAVKRRAEELRIVRTIATLKAEGETLRRGSVENPEQYSLLFR